jgi:hypothetical protein
MGLGKSFISKSGILGELLIFLWHRKLWWLIPTVVILVLLGTLLVLGGTGVAPFIYTLF